MKDKFLRTNKKKPLLKLCQLADCPQSACTWSNHIGVRIIIYFYVFSLTVCGLENCAQLWLHCRPRNCVQALKLPQHLSYKQSRLPTLLECSGLNCLSKNYRYNTYFGFSWPAWLSTEPARWTSEPGSNPSWNAIQYTPFVKYLT